MAAPLKCIKFSNSAKYLATKKISKWSDVVVPHRCVQHSRSFSQLCRTTRQFSRLQPHMGAPARLKPYTCIGVWGTVRCNSSMPSPELVDDLMSEETLEQVGAVLEPTFESLGLGGGTPVGLVQQGLEFLHVTCGLPWWGSIVVGALAIRLCLLPLHISQHKQAYTIVTKHQEIEEIILKKDYEISIENHQGAKEMNRDLKNLTTSTVNSGKLLLPTALQVPILMSILPALYQMAQVPIQSMKTGGMFFTPDLTITDETMVLPVMVGVVMWHYIKDGAPISTCLMILKQSWWNKLLLLPCIGTIVMMFYSPSAITLYLLTTSIYNFSIYYLLRSQTVRTLFKFPPDVQHPIKGYAWKRPRID